MNETNEISVQDSEQKKKICSVCGGEIPDGAKFIIDETTGKPVCSDCAGDYVKCRHCGKYFPEECMFLNNAEEYVCSYCVDYLYDKCECCGELVLKEDIVWLNDSCYCEYCFEQLKKKGKIVRCDDCGEWILEENAYYKGEKCFCPSCEGDWFICDDCGGLCRTGDAVTTHDGSDICSDCYDDHYFTCDCCNRIYHCDDMSDEDNVCVNCNGEYGLKEYHNFRRRRMYNCRHCNEDGCGIPYLGVELECDRGNFDYDDFSKWTDDNYLIHFERDGSLSSKGVELITQPCSLLFHQKKMDWKNILDILTGQGFKSHSTDTCGLHVHISRDALESSTIVKLDYFINRHHRFFEDIARRNSADYSKFVEKTIPDKSKAYVTDDDRYVAVNTTNEETVEIRIFRGSLKYETVIGTIELCHALVYFLENISFCKLTKFDATAIPFVDYCGENADKYPHIIPLMLRLVKEERKERENIVNWSRKLEEKKGK